MLAIFLIFQNLESDEIYFAFTFTPGIRDFVFSHIKFYDVIY